MAFDFPLNLCFLFYSILPSLLSYRFDARVRELLDFSIYLDISDDVKFAWKIQVCREETGGKDPLIGVRVYGVTHSVRSVASL